MVVRFRLFLQALIWQWVRIKTSTTRNGTRKNNLKQPSPRGLLSQAEAAFSLLEIIVVVAIVAFVYSVALPNFAIQTGTEVANRLGRLSEDVRAAYDLTVLSGKPHRLVFQLYAGQYWLESSDSQHITLGDRLLAADPSPAEEKERQAAFQDEFAKYEDLAGEAVKDPETDTDIPPVTPVLKAKEALQGPSWSRVDTAEWQKRSLGEQLLLRDVQAEHHERPISVDDQGREALAMLYFLPSGYVEKAVMHIYYRKGEYEIDESQEPYTVVIDSYLGTADIRSGYEEINVHRDDEGM